MMISAASGFINQTEKYSRDNAGQSLKKYTLLKKGELAYNHGASKIKPYGCCFELLEEEARIPYVYHCFKINNEYSTSYIAKYLNNSKTDSYLKKIVSSSVRMDGLLNISYEDYTDMLLRVPSIKEQQKIADFLSLVDKRIDKQRQLVENLKKYKRGLFESCFSKLSNFKTLKLGSFAKIYQPATISQSEFTNGPYRVFGANGYIGYYDEYNHSAAQVTVSCRGEKCGTVNYVDEKTWITGNSMVINIDDNEILNKRFLYHCLSNQNLKYLISGSAQPQIVRSSIEQHKIHCPNLTEQNKIAIILDKYESLIQTSETTLSELIKYKSGLLQQMFI